MRFQIYLPRQYQKKSCTLPITVKNNVYSQVHTEILMRVSNPPYFFLSLAGERSIERPKMIHLE